MAHHKRVYTITEADVGKPFLRPTGETCSHCGNTPAAPPIYVESLMGQVLPVDVGRVVYQVPADDVRCADVYQLGPVQEEAAAEHRQLEAESLVEGARERDAG